MLTGPGWRPDAIVRLLLGVFVCVYAGSLAASALEFHPTVTRPAARFYWFLGMSLACLAASIFFLRRSWTMEHFMRRTTPMVVCFYVGLALGSVAQRMTGPVAASVPQMLIAALSFQGAALVMAVFFLREHHIGCAEAFGLHLNWRAAMLAGFVVALVFLPTAWLMQKGSALLLERLTFLPWEPEEQQAVQTLRETAGLGHRASMAVITILLAPVAEEFLFRGVLYPGLKQLGHPRMALWLTSILFAVVHLNAITFIPLMVFAVVLTGLYERTGNLLASISAHATFNAINFSLLMLST